MGSVNITPLEIAKRLSLAKVHDERLQLFGASTHRYQLNSCLNDDELRGFETTFGIVLPEQYRDFLLRFGNGGAGPGYGLLSLRKSIDEFGNDDLRRLSRPFIPPRAAREKVVDRDYPEDGILPLAHMGCGHMWVLIVTGAERGAIWTYLDGGDYDPAHHEIPEYPPSATLEQRLEANDRMTDELLSNPLRRLSFWDWYLDWLDSASPQSL